MQIPLIFLATLAVSSAVSTNDVLKILNTGVGQRNSQLEELVLGVIESLRDVMVTGADDIPVLDPLNLDNVHLDLEELLELENSHITLKNFEARHLSTFIIDDLSIVNTNLLLQRYDFDVEGYIPLLEADADQYDLNVLAMGFHLFGAGKVKVKIIEPRIIAKLEVNLNIFGLSLNIRSANVMFRLGAVEPELTGMFGSTVSDQFVNLFIKNLVEDILQTYEDDVSEILSRLVLEVGNDILGDLDLGGLLPTLLNQEADTPIQNMEKKQEP